MASTPMMPLERQIAHAHQRLFWQTWLRHLPYCCAALLALAAAWLVLQTLMVGPSALWLRWTVLVSAFALGAALALALTLWRGPSRLDAALALDERFGLKERVTTALTLTTEQAASPAGVALLADVQQHLEKLNVASRFPWRPNWRRGLVTAAAAALAAFAVFAAPTFRTSQADAQDPKLLSADKAEAIEKARAEAKKKLAEAKKQNPPKSKQMQQLDVKLEQLFDKAGDPKSKDDNRKQIEDIQKLEKENSNLLKDAQTAAQKKADLEQQLKDLENLTAKDKNKDGPAKDLLDAVNKGDPAKAEAELKKLADQLANNKLNEEQMKKLAEQLANLEKQTGQLAQQGKDIKDLQKQLEDAKKKGELSKEELAQLQQLQQQDDLQKLSDDLKECQACMKKGDGKKAAQQLAKAGDKLQKAAGKKGELQAQIDAEGVKAQGLKQLQTNQKLLQDTRLTICENLGLGNGNGPMPGGPRPSKKADFGVNDGQDHASVDEKGQFKAVGDAPNLPGTKTMIPSKELPGVLQQTAQEAQQALDRQPIAPEAAELLKGYYENLSGQKK